MQTISINFQIPASWSQLSDKQLRKVYELIASDMDADEIIILCLLRWSDTKVVGRQPDGSYLLKKGKTLFEATPTMLAEILPHLDWLEQISPMPVRVAKLNRRKAIAADFQEVSFETFIVCDNLYQGYLQTQDEDLLQEIGRVVYQDDKLKLNAWSRISVFYWIASLKEYFANRFSNFFQPATQSESSGNLLGDPLRSPAHKLQESMDSMIRALTKGDITKEKEILAMDTWRALTELNAQAKEYKQINAQINAKK